MGKIKLKNNVTGWQSEFIDIDSAVLVLSSQTLDQVKNWYATVEDGLSWMPILLYEPLVNKFINVNQKNVEVISESIQMPFAMNVDLALDSALRETHTQNLTTEIAETNINAQTHLNTESNTFVEPTLEYPNSSVQNVFDEKNEKRQHSRFEIKLRTIIKSGKNTYLTYSKDVSMGGLCLINDVPEYIFNSEAEIYITAPDGKNNIMFSCLPIATKLGKSRLMFTKIDPSKMKIFEAWVNHFIKPTAQKVS